MLDPKLVSLHKHWVTADAVKQAVNVKIKVNKDFSEIFLQQAELHSVFQRLSVLYALIYVVVEGFVELKCEDADVEKLLSQVDYVDTLRLFRNATFHYQKEPISAKALKFLELEESEIWIQKLHHSFGKYFERALPINEMLAKLKARQGI